MPTADRVDAPEGRRRNKRARLVCVRCHEKKIKCDLQAFTGQEEQRCTGCLDAFTECRVRLSQRGTARRRGPGAAAPNFVGAAAVEDLNVDPLPNTSLEDPSQTIGSIPFSQPSMRTPNEERLSRRPPTATPGQLSQSSQANSHRAAYLGESGYMSMFSHEPAEDEAASQKPTAENRPTVLLPVLQESYLDTYFDYCYTWCPILDRATMQSCTEFGDSMLLREAVAVLGSHLSPPLMPHPKPRQHYLRTKALFYDNHEDQPLVRICAVMLLYWWSTGPPNVASIDTNWWWMGASIRLAQEIGIHRDQDSAPLPRPGETKALRRRIWWTLFARDRLTAIMQGRPCAIDPDYCDVKMVTTEDFPDPADSKAEIFIQWVQLCEIIGRIGKAIAQGRMHDLNSLPAKDLIAWAQSLKALLQLPLSTDRTTNFNRDIHLLHLPYLATMILLHLQKGNQKLPRASATAIVAASCVARIFEDFLARSSLKFVPGQAGWYIAVAILALLHARQIETLKVHADADIATLRTALKQMATRWHSSKMFSVGFDKILEVQNPASGGLDIAGALRDVVASTTHPLDAAQAPVSPTLDDLTGPDTVQWTDCFPYVTTQTSPLIAALLANSLKMPISGWDSSQFTYLFDFLDGLDPDPEILQMELNL